jgi:hypothetical protein
VARFGKRVAWVGVVMIHDDGSTFAVEMDGNSQHITWEMTQEVEVRDVPFGRATQDSWREFEPGVKTIEIHVRGVGGEWTAGYSAAPQPRSALAETPQAIEP